MGKTRKMLKSLQNARTDPYQKQLQNDMFATPTGRKKDKSGGRKDTTEKYVDERLTKRILRQARLQQQQEDDGVEQFEQKLKKPLTVSENSDNEEEEGVDSDTGEQDYDYSEVIVDEKDEQALQVFMNPADTKMELGSEIWATIKEKQTELDEEFKDVAGDGVVINPVMEEIYTGVGEVLSKYRHGKLPKAFKKLPHEKNWPKLLQITEPEKWSAAAMFEGTKVFVSSLKENGAVFFVRTVLMPRVRDDIQEYKRLNYHLYQALGKCFYKPKVFMKGFLLPLCESRTCTLREAIIISSVVSKFSIPLAHCATAIMMICELEYSGSTSLILRALINKNHSLQYKVVDRIVDHFVRFRTETRALPVLWHQCLLTFAERHKADCTAEQKAQLNQVTNIHFHSEISPLICKELASTPDCVRVDVSKISSVIPGGVIM